MKKNPALSVVIPAYNEEHFLPRCLESLKNQKNPPSYEVIVVDNNSTDRTAAIAQEYGVRLVKEREPGVVFARDTGLRASKGAIIVSTDADTYFSSRWLANIADYFESHPESAGLAGHYYFVKGPLWAKIWPFMGAVLVKIIYEVFGKTIYVSAANLAFRRNCVSQYNTNHPQGGDETELLKELAQHGPVHVTLKNAVFTSARRVNQGFLHSILVTVGYYYFFNLLHTKHVGGKSVIGAMPAIRTESRSVHWRLLSIQWVITISIFAMIIAVAKHRVPHIW